LGAMSPEIIEGVVKASSMIKKPLMLISTQNQINFNRGYVNNWTTKEYIDFVNKLRKKYKDSKVYICRDHCGPGFSSKSMNVRDVYNTLSDDIENDFDLIHVDFSKFNKDSKIVLSETKKVIEWILKQKKDISIEIGTEENVGEWKNDFDKIEKEINFFKEFIAPEFFVVQTGSLVKEINQVGSFNKEFIPRTHELLSEHGLKLKEHNADYLDSEMIKKRKDIVDAMNIAPQLGVIQTQVVISEALIYGLDINPFLNCSYNSRAWEKWLYKSTPENKMLCSIIAGHYNFYSDEYRKLISDLEKYIDINDLIISKIINLIQYYDYSLYDNKIN
jgi:D-tagatose-1,6-bisphosphate aldolase subunit GatZ/KbaZ